jgi:hypothetical protein
MNSIALLQFFIGESLGFWWWGRWGELASWLYQMFDATYVCSCSTQHSHQVPRQAFHHSPQLKPEELNREDRFQTLQLIVASLPCLKLQAELPQPWLLCLRASKAPQESHPLPPGRSY